MNNDDEAKDANDNGEDFDIGLPETERQELARLRRERAQEILMLRQERERLLLEIAQRRRVLEVQAETRRIWAEDADFREA